MRHPRWWRWGESNPRPWLSAQAAFTRRIIHHTPEGWGEAYQIWTTSPLTCSRRLLAFFYFVPDQRPEGGERPKPLPVLLAHALRRFMGSRCPNMTRSHKIIILPREQTPKRLVSLQGFQRFGLRRSIPIQVSEKFANLNAQTLDLSVAGVLVKITHSFIFLERGQSQRPISPKWPKSSRGSCSGASSLL